MRNSFKLVLIALAFIVCLAALAVVSANASADTHVWDGGGADTKFSTDANWFIWGGANDVEPTAGDDIKFWDWDTSCSWDVALIVGTITIGANYSGTITQGAVDFGYSDFSKSGGTWTGGSSQWQTCSGNWTSTYLEASGIVSQLHHECIFKLLGLVSIK